MYMSLFGTARGAASSKGLRPSAGKSARPPSTMGRSTSRVLRVRRLSVCLSGCLEFVPIRFLQPNKMKKNTQLRPLVDIEISQVDVQLGCPGESNLAQIVIVWKPLGTGQAPVRSCMKLLPGPSGHHLRLLSLQKPPEETCWRVQVQ